jgi:hypothetical protein
MMIVGGVALTGHAINSAVYGSGGVNGGSSGVERPRIMSQDTFEDSYSDRSGIIYLAPPKGGIGHIDL